MGKKVDGKEMTNKGEGASQVANNARRKSFRELLTQVDDQIVKNTDQITRNRRTLNSQQGPLGKDDEMRK